MKKDIIENQYKKGSIFEKIKLLKRYTWLATFERYDLETDCFVKVAIKKTNPKIFKTTDGTTGDLFL